MKRERHQPSPSTVARKTFGQLLSGVDGATLLRGSEVPVHSVCFDSRKASSGALFVALRGSYSDGHDYLDAARKNGATACVIDRDALTDSVTDYAAIAVVPDSRKALSEIARRYYEHPSRDLKLVGITGTDGKTTTSFMVDHLLRRAGYSTGLITTVATRMPGASPISAGRQTTPESLEIQRLLFDMREAGADVVILETSSHGLETHRVDGCVFDVGVITNITHEHLDFHGTLEAYRRAKRRLFDFVDLAREEGGLGVAIVNMDDPGARTAIREPSELTFRRYGILSASSCDVSAMAIEPHDGGYRFKLGVPGVIRDVDLPVVGRWNISNALAAVSVCLALGVSVDPIIEGLRTMPAIPGRMQSLDAGQPFNVLVDYAHTAPALEQLLQAVRETTAGSILVVFGSAGERDIEKRAEMGAVAHRCADFTLITSEDPRFENPDAIIDAIAGGAIRAGAVEGVDFDRLEDRRTAIFEILRRAECGDTVVLAGKGHEQSMIYGSEARPWNESDIALDGLRALGYSTSPSPREGHD
ncbi:MAG: UDP-N-acetylmuramoyl-L-alanyl-D-glutamate--2,6-diaminopimelate ligase [Thermomicrobiales bacterium]